MESLRIENSKLQARLEWAHRRLREQEQESQEELERLRDENAQLSITCREMALDLLEESGAHV